MHDGGEARVGDGAEAALPRSASLLFPDHGTLIHVNAPKIQILKDDIMFLEYTRAIITNRGAASRCQGCQQLIQFLDLYTYLTNLGCRQISALLSKGAANLRRLGNTALGFCSSNEPPQYISIKYYGQLP